MGYDELGQLLSKDNEKRQWYVQKSLYDTNLIDEVRQSSLKELPEVTEIASIQGKLALRLLNSSNKVSSDFPIEDILPLYLRGASVTLKSNATKSPTTKS